MCVGLIKTWAICYQFLVYKVDSGDQDSDCLCILDLESNNAIVRIKNIKGLDDSGNFILISIHIKYS